MPLAAIIRLKDDDLSQADAARAERRIVRENSTVRLQGVAHDASVDNLSATGCLIRVKMQISLGQRLRIGLAGGGVADGIVVRCEARAYGVAFDTPLSAATLANAFSGTTLLAGFEGDYRSGAPGVESVDDLDIQRWPRPVRALTMIGAAAAIWAIILALVGN